MGQCTIDINIKHQKEPLVASTSLNLRRNSLKVKVLPYSKFYFENTGMVNQKVCQKKYLSRVFGVDRKICHLGPLFGITRQVS